MQGNIAEKAEDILGNLAVHIHIASDIEHISSHELLGIYGERREGIDDIARYSPFGRSFSDLKFDIDPVFGDFLKFGLLKEVVGDADVSPGDTVFRKYQLFIDLDFISRIGNISAFGFETQPLSLIIESEINIVFSIVDGKSVGFDLTDFDRCGIDSWKY